MKYFFLLTYLSLFFGCDKPKELILDAKLNGFNYTEIISFYSDSTFNIKRNYEFDSIRNKNFKGTFRILKDSFLCTGDINFNCFIKNNYLELEDEYLKYEILNSNLNRNFTIDFNEIPPNYTFFSYKKTPSFSPINLEGLSQVELTENDILKIDSLLLKCMNNTEYFKDKKNFNNYFKLCIPAKNYKNDILVFVDCKCNSKTNENYKYFISKTMDGGPCYFNILLNITRDDCVEISINSY